MKLCIRQRTFSWTGSYDVCDNPACEMPGLLLVIAIDAANCGSDK